jgi:cytochrome P450
MATDRKKEGFVKRFLHKFYEKKEAPRYSFSKTGNMRVHNITDAKTMRSIYRDMDHFSGIQFVRHTFKKLVGSALIMDEGESWDMMHKILAPSFAPSAIEKNIAPIAIDECNKMIDRWEQQGKVADVEKEMKYMTGRVIMRALFSDTVSEKDGQDIIGEIAHAMGGAKQPRGFDRIKRKLNIPYDHAGFLPPLIRRVIGTNVDKPASVPKRFTEATKKLDEILYRIIEERRKLTVQPDDILGKLITARKDDGTSLTNSEIRDQALMVVVTGHETTAEGMTFSLLELIKNPDKQKALRDEFNAVVAQGALTGRAYNRLPKAQNSFKEALRMHPTVFMSTRECAEDTVVDGIEFKKHDLIRMDLRKVHHDPEYWPEPDTFRPERFEKEKFPQAYMPFGTGPRVCLGMNMSLFEGTLMLSQIFNRLEIKADKLPEGEAYYFTTRPQGSFEVSVKKLDQPAAKPGPGIAPPTP